MTEAGEGKPDGDELFERMRPWLARLAADGYAEIKRVVGPHECHVWLQGPGGRVVVSIDPKVSALEIRILPERRD